MEKVMGPFIYSKCYCVSEVQ